jgi:hypothetical protein
VSILNGNYPERSVVEAEVFNSTDAGKLTEKRYKTNWRLPPKLFHIL